jgi:Flp pilus assembly protein TadG
MNPRKNEDGQAFVLMALALVVILGMAALVLDAGAWFRTDRRLQQTADAAALAGVQELPKNPVLARTTALNYAEKNGGDVAFGDIEVTSTFNPNDTLSVKAQKEEAGFFSKVLGVDKTQISAYAKARVDSPVSARYVAPMVVYCDHELIRNCDGTNDLIAFGVPTTLKYDKFGAPGAFGMLNLGKKGGDDDDEGTPGTSEQADWIRRGFDKFLGTGKFRSNPGAKFSSTEIRGALDDRINTVLLFPVFRTLEGEGQNAKYDIIGWIGFNLLSYKVNGNNAELTGYFTEFIAQGVLASSGSGVPPTFGVKSIQLIE